MTPAPDLPQAYQTFRHRYPKIGQAWDLLTAAGQDGPLDGKTVRLIKLAISIGALREGAVHAGVRKARAAGVSRAEIEQVVALAASTLGLPATVAVHSWITDEIGEP